MNLPANLGTLDWSNWLRGVIGGFIGGGAGAFGAGSSAMLFLDPAYLASHGTGIVLKLMSGTFLISGITGMMLFLAKEPIPSKIKTVETTKETTQVGTKAPTVVETVKETVVQSVPTEPKS